MVEFINFHLIPGLVLGSIYALGAIGLSLVFGIMRFANFAHGETMTLGTYVTYTLIKLTPLHGMVALPVALMLVVPAAMAITALVMLLIDRMFYKPFRNSASIILVIASFGMMLMIRSTVQVIWGPQLKVLVTGIQPPWFVFETFRILPKHVMIIGCALALMGVVHYLLSYTKIGKAMRAMSDSPELARLTGIDTEAVVRATWVVGTVLAVAAGVFLAIDSQIETMMGFKLLLPVFASAILGGIGRPYGAMAGGLMIGVAEELSTFAWIGSESLLSPSYKAGVSFAIMVAMLIWRPHGLFKGRAF
jgi:branched-subunit amino acid ABC-type transport system permease component